MNDGIGSSRRSIGVRNSHLLSDANRWRLGGLRSLGGRLTRRHDVERGLLWRRRTTLSGMEGGGRLHELHALVEGWLVYVAGSVLIDKGNSRLSLRHASLWAGLLEGWILVRLGDTPWASALLLRHSLKRGRMVRIHNWNSNVGVWIIRSPTLLLGRSSLLLGGPPVSGGGRHTPGNERARLGIEHRDLATDPKRFQRLKTGLRLKHGSNTAALYHTITVD